MTAFSDISLAIASTLFTFIYTSAAAENEKNLGLCSIIYNNASINSCGRSN